MKLPKSFSIHEIAGLVGGTVQINQISQLEHLDKNNTNEVSKIAEELKVDKVSFSPLTAGEGELVFLFDEKLLKNIDECKASIKIIPSGTKCSGACIYVDRPMLAIQKVLSYFPVKRYFPQKGTIHPTALIDPSCKIGKDVAIGAYVVIEADTKIADRSIIMSGVVIGGAVEIGEDCLIYPGCIIADHVKMGNRVILQAGAVLGSDGFAYVTTKESNLERRMAGKSDIKDESNPHLKIPQIGTVILGDDVEVGSCATIDRATMGATTIGRGSKIDNQVMIAHNCKIGEEVLLVAQVALGGSCKIADRVIVAGDAAVADHINIEKDAIVQGKTGVMRDIPQGGVVTGTPAVPHREFMTQQVLLKKLPKILTEFKSMQKRIEELELLVKEKALVSQER